MRIITGSARGRRLETPEGYDVRPTTDRVKEAIFSSIQFDIEGRRVLDLFSGSGQLGLEALSRGAESAVFVDLKPESFEITKRNIKSTGFEAKAKAYRQDYSSFLAGNFDTFDIAFLDPPYKTGILADALKKVTAVMSEYGMIICEHPSDEPSVEEVDNGFKRCKELKSGKIAVSIYKKERD